MLGAVSKAEVHASAVAHMGSKPWHCEFAPVPIHAVKLAESGRSKLVQPLHATLRESNLDSLDEHF